MDNDRRAIVRARSLLAIEHFCGGDVRRAVLKGVKIDAHKDGAVLVATDGINLAAIQDDGGYVAGLETVWQCNAAKTYGKALAKWEKKDNARLDVWADLTCEGLYNGTLRIMRADNPAQILAGNGELLREEAYEEIRLHGTFPPWVGIFHSDERLPSPKACIPGRLLKEQIKKVLDFAGVYHFHHFNWRLAFWPDCPGQRGIRVTIANDPTVAIAMMAPEEDDDAINPDWLAALLKEAS